jgi:hypothetical protein
MSRTRSSSPEDCPWLDPPRTIGVPAFVFSKADVLSYLQHCREHCVATLEEMTSARAAERCGFPWYDMSVGELLLLNLRHVQHHAGQPALVLRRRTGLASTGSALPRFGTSESRSLHPINA